MRTIGRGAALVVSGVLLAATVTSCGRFLVADSASEEDWEEVFDFEVQPGNMNPAQAEQVVGQQVGIGQLVSGSVVHRGSVQGPGGTVNFYAYRMVDPEMGPQPVFCTSTVASSSMSAGCGDQGPIEPMSPIQIDGGSWGGLWRTAGFVVQDDVVRVEATAADGTLYTIVPGNGVGYIEWLDERGSLELVAYDAQDQELGRAFAGLDR